MAPLKERGADGEGVYTRRSIQSNHMTDGWYLDKSPSNGGGGVVAVVISEREKQLSVK